MAGYSGWYQGQVSKVPFIIYIDNNFNNVQKLQNSDIIFSALPSHDPDEINKDIASVKEYIDRKDEL